MSLGCLDISNAEKENRDRLKKRSNKDSKKQKTISIVIFSLFVMFVIAVGAVILKIIFKKIDSGVQVLA